MWVFFGLISVTTFALVAFRTYLRAQWKGEPGHSGGIPFELRRRTNKGALVGVDVGVRGAGPFTFTLKHEGATSGWAKRVGLSVEVQTGDRAFDDAVYVVSDDPIFCRKLKESAALRERLLALFQTVDLLRLREVRCAAGRLWLVMTPTGRRDVEDVVAAAEIRVPALRAIADELSRVQVRFGDRLRDPFIARAAALLAISTALFAYALFAFLRISVERPVVMLAPGKVFATSLPWSVGVAVALVVATLVLLGRSARAHLVLLEVVAMGGLGAVGAGYMLTRDLNEALDDAPAQHLRVEVLGSRINQGKHKTYYLHVRDWTGQKPSRELQVYRSLYEQVGRGHEVELTVRQGGFGLPWLERIEPVRPAL